MPVIRARTMREKSVAGQAQAIAGREGQCARCRLHHRTRAAA
jgi:hypothetical protein